MIKENSFIVHENLVSFIFVAAHLVKRNKNALQNKENKKTKICRPSRTHVILGGIYLYRKGLKVMIL